MNISQKLLPPCCRSLQASTKRHFSYYLCGGDDYESMHALCQERGESLLPLVELPNGCSSVDTFARVLQLVKPQSLYSCLQIYGKDLISDLAYRIG